MKKRTIKSLELNKKTVSTLKTSNVKAGSWFSITCGYYVMTIAEAIDEYFVDQD